MTDREFPSDAAPRLNLIKLSVGTGDVAHLAELQKRRLSEAIGAGRGERLFHVTRNTPRRSAELLAGGSIYWVIKGRIRVRQRLAGFETDADHEGKRICRLMLDPRLVETEAWRCRPFQGWRYLLPDAAPADLGAGWPDLAIPGAMAAELRELGLI